MARLVSVFVVFVCQIGLSLQTCAECACCKGSFNCDSNKNCVNGCIDGSYGSKCTEKCLENCKTCENSYECTECKPGYYTNKCNLQCGNGCVNSTCSKLSGECTCKSADFVKYNCDYCLGHKYGNECEKTCPSNCGSCISEKYCVWCVDTAYYGSNCQYRCSVGCVDKICNKGTGYCNKGCKPGFAGDKCDICSFGLYGPNCDLNCTENCIECISATNCTKCKSGFYGDTCANACPAGCDKTCSFSTGQHFNLTEKYRVCEKDTGRCLHGCNLVTKYGDFCEKQCSNTCYNKSCDLKTGHCLEGCEINVFGSFCDNSCSTSCISQTGKRICDGIKGHCLFGCKDGFYGKRCDNMCSSLCVNTTCNQTTAECLYGCIDGFKGPKCAEAIIPDREGYYTRSTLIGSTIGTFLAGGIVVGIAFFITFIVWRRRNIQTKEVHVHRYENAIPCGNGSNDNTHESDSPVTYEDLKSRDERLYSQITSSQQISPPATDYVNYSS